MNCPRVIIAGTHSGVGKTTIALGLMAALKRRGSNVQPFKVGPDYIDPTYHNAVTGNISRNLDSCLLSKNTILELFHRKASAADLSVIEGVMGLYDGKGSTGEGSTAQVARILNAPVILVIDAGAMSRSAGAVALGYREFDRKTALKAVILNNVAGKAHYNCLKDSIERNTDVHVLGFVPNEKTLVLPGRHLGLVPVTGKNINNAYYSALADHIEAQLPVDRIIALAASAGDLPAFKKTIFKNVPLKEDVTIAVAKDAAFHFYYEDNLDILKHLGANIVTFSPLTHKRLPENIDGVYIGGGFPELYANKLAKNHSLIKDLRKRAGEGMPLYAECGGLMYLMKRLTDMKKCTFPMAGIFPYSVAMGNKLHSLGYVDVVAVKDSILLPKGRHVRGHIFHWSYLKENIRSSSCSFKLLTGNTNSFFDGLSLNNILCSYVHFHFASNIILAQRYLKACKKHKTLTKKERNN